MQIQYQLKFDMPQAGKAASSMISQRWKILTVAEKYEFSENLVDAPTGEWSAGCCQENVRLSDLI